MTKPQLLPLTPLILLPTGVTKNLLPLIRRQWILPLRWLCKEILPGYLKLGRLPVLSLDRRQYTSRGVYQGTLVLLFLLLFYHAILTSSLISYPNTWSGSLSGSISCIHLMTPITIFLSVSGSVLKIQLLNLLQHYII